MKQTLTLLVLMISLSGCNKQGGIDLTYKIITNNSDGTYNSFDLSGWLMFIILCGMCYCAGRYNDKLINRLFIVLFSLIILLGIICIIGH